MVAINYRSFSKAVTANGYPSPSREVYDEFVKATEDDFSLDEAAMFLAQLIHESGGFQHTEEERFAGKNHHYYRDKHALEGKTYHGRGYIQLTYASNYLAASQALGRGKELLKHPQRVADDVELAMEVSKWYWLENVRPRLEERPDCFGVTTQAINGALECRQSSGHDLARRRYKVYRKVAEALDIRELASESGCYN